MQYGDFYYPHPVNEPVLSYAPGSAERTALKKTIKEMKAEHLDVPMYIGSEEVRTGNTLELRPPHELKHLLGNFHVGDAKHVAKAINASLKAKDKWAGMSWENRANIFLKAADLLATKYRFHINAATMLGQSKNVMQAELDAACELIDFLRFNVHYLSEIYRQQPASASGMYNRVEYRPLEGFVFALTPFNFTAIGGNLPTVAAMCGNVVVWKCANTQVYSAQLFMRILKEAGLPDGVINLIYVDGPTCGDVIFKHPDFAGLHFTGSTHGEEKISGDG
jgi:1-pyrroline-5-carboxylate dehydrogenase